MTEEVARAVELLRAGELVAIPTETVYGLAADATNPAAVARIFTTKGRPASHPLIVHLRNAEALDAWAQDIPLAARQLAAAFWPGPLTLILKRQSHVLDAVTGGQDTVGLRVPNHPLALSLLHEFSRGARGACGLAAPSANRYGRISPTSAADVRAELGATIPMVLDGGPCDVGIESTIIDFSGPTPRILRPGAITAAAIAETLGVPALADSAASAAVAAPRVAGSDAAHYAPLTPLQLVAGEALAEAIRGALAIGLSLAVLSHSQCPLHTPGLTWQVAASEASTYAHDLYARLRALDALGSDLILIEAPPASEAWLAVADRLQRAACGSGKSGVA